MPLLQRFLTGAELSALLKYTLCHSDVMQVFLKHNLSIATVLLRSQKHSFYVDNGLRKNTIGTWNTN